ncbi:MAG: hypothetical protein KA354_04090 [Phycisphaerae bacterium]|nr:hypothetical protein [Phycisphaerae bacterium]
MCSAVLLATSLAAGCRDELPTKPRTADAAEAATNQPAKPTAGQENIDGRRVLLVHSCHPEYPWVDSVTQGVKAAMQGTRLALEVLYMDTKMVNSDTAAILGISLTDDIAKEATVVSGRSGPPVGVATM